MIITENKLRQIVRQELLNLLEGTQPREDLAILFSLLQQLGTFHFGGKKEELTLSNLTEIELKLNLLINEIKEMKLGIDEGLRSTLRYYFGREQEQQPTVEPQNDLQIKIKTIKNKLFELEDLIDTKRAGKNRQYDIKHKEVVLPVLEYIEGKLRFLVQSNTAYPARSELTKRDILKRKQRGY
jgi:hypothetical protein